MKPEDIQEIKDHITVCFNGNNELPIVNAIKHQIFLKQSDGVILNYLYLGKIDIIKLKVEIDSMGVLRDGTLDGLDGSKFFGLEIIECARNNFLKVG